jgi:hypothetical protein
MLSQRADYCSACLVAWQTKRTKKAGIVGKYGDFHSAASFLFVFV